MASAELGALVIKIGADLTDFKNQMKDFQKELKKTFGKDTIDLSKDLVTGVEGLGVAMLAAAGMSIKMAGDLNESKVAFTALLGSAEAATTFLNQLQQLEQKSPFEFKELEATSRKLIGVGFSAQQIIPMLQAAGGAVSMLGTAKQGGLETVLNAFEKIKASNQVTSRDMKSLTSEGIPAWDMLAKKIGVDVPTAMKMVKAGSIDAKTGITALVVGMDDTFGKMKGKIENEIPESVKHMGDAMGDIARTAGEKLIDGLGLTKIFKNIADSLQEFADIFKNQGLEAAMDKVFGPGVEFAIMAIAGAVTAALVPGLISLGVAAAATLVPLLPYIGIGVMIASAAYLIWKNWGPVLKLLQAGWIMLNWAAREVFIEIGQAFLLLAYIITSNATKLFGWIPGIGDKIKGVNDKVKELQSDLSKAHTDNWNDMNKQIEDVGKSTKKVTAATKDLKQALPTAKDFDMSSIAKDQYAFVETEKKLEAQLKAAYDNYDFASYKKLLSEKNVAFLASLDYQKSAMNDYMTYMMAANKRIEDFGLSAMKVVFNGLNDSLWSVIDGTKTLGDAMADLGKQILKTLTNQLIQKFLGNIFAGNISGLTTDTLNASATGTTADLIGIHAAEGAYVTRPTVTLFGEAGPEYALPESKVDGFVAAHGGGSVHIENNVINNAGGLVQATTTSSVDDNGKTILSTFIEAVALNKGNIKQIIKAAAK